MALPMELYSRPGRALDTNAEEQIGAAKNLYDKLHNGVMQGGPHRIPIGGDITKLPYCIGLCRGC